MLITDFSDKKACREQIRATRSRIAPDVISKVSEEIQEHLLDFLGTRDFAAVAAYLAVRNEPLIHPAMERDLTHGKRWYFPRVLPGGAMEFVAWRKDEPLRKGKFGIAEPADGQRLTVEGRDILLLLPCVAVDTSGTRLGSGAGYYDRFLAKIADRSRVWLAAVCMEQFVLSEKLPAEPHDVPVQGVFTETGLRIF
ncbi:MAG: hypothetical protein RIQ81_2175 [Pseudomonadota bacterium]